MITYFWP